MRIDKEFQLAYRYYQSGDLNQASNVYKKILKVQPGNIDVLRFLGGICYQLGDYDDAIRYIRKEIEITPSNADVYYKLGTVLQAKGLLSDAIDCFRKAITLKPCFPDAYYNLGFAYQNTGQIDEAILNYQKAIQIEPGLTEAYNNLGILLIGKGRLEEAITYFQKAIRINPDCADIYNNLGLILQESGQLDEAILHYKYALQLKPNFTDAYFNIGNAYEEKGQFDDALTSYYNATLYNPDFIEAFYKIGSILYKQKKQLDEAIMYYEKVLLLNPHSVFTYNDIGNIFHDKGLLDEAISYYKKALESDPSYVGSYVNLGKALEDNGSLDEAISYYKKAIEIDPNDAQANSNLSIALLLSGNFKEGWKEYEWRWKLKDFFKREFSQPLWDGFDITGKTILLYDEQGFGDAVQFIRYVPLVIKRGAKLIIECQKELISLFQNIEGIHQIIAQDEHLPLFDIHCPLMSLPLVFGTTIDTIPAEIPYIKVNTLLVQKWKDKVKDDDSEFKVGLSWAGRSEHKNDRNRSFPLDTFTPLAQFDNIVFYSLQKGKGSEQVKSPPDGMKFIDYTDEIQDFLDTAALIENLDLIISADTAVVHLAGALGKPVWTLIPFAPDWRWMLNRDDSPWYPTMRLFRQTSWGDWETVINRIKKELREWLTT